MDANARIVTGLIWGLKASFLAYLGRMGDAQTTTAGGGGITDVGDFYFELADNTEFDQFAGLGTLKFRGEIHFAAHFGMLNLTIADPWLEFRPGHALMTIDAPVSNEANAPADRLPFMTVDLRPPVAHEGALLWADAQTFLTDQGSLLFNSAYPVGEPFAPLSFRIVQADHLQKRTLTD